MAPAEVGRHTSLSTRHAKGIAASVVAMSMATPAFAQSPTPEDMASARSLGVEGVQLADSGNCAGAIPKLEAAEKLFHAPSTLEKLGECQLKVGHLVAGTESLNKVIREPLSPNAPAAFVSARQHAQELLGPALARIGKLRVHIQGAPPDRVTVTVDGDPVPSALFDADRPTDPGPHEVKAVATGYKAAVAPVTVPEGAQATVNLSLEPEPAGQPAPPAPVAPASGTPEGAAPAPPAGPVSPAAPQSTPSAPAPASHGSSTAFAVGSLVVGGVGAVVGTVFGVIALGNKSSLDSHCPTKSTCPTSQRSTIDSLSTNATISTVGFGVGIVGVLVGTILLATSHGSEPQAPAAPAPAARIWPWFALGTAGIEGRFQ